MTPDVHREIHEERRVDWDTLMERGSARNPQPCALAASAASTRNIPAETTIDILQYALDFAMGYRIPHTTSQINLRLSSRRFKCTRADMWPIPSAPAHVRCGGTQDQGKVDLDSLRTPRCASVRFILPVIFASRRLLGQSI